MTDLHYDYNHSGLSTKEAIEDAQERTVNVLIQKGWPRLVAKFASKLFIMQMRCDGCQRIGKTDGRLKNGIWGKSDGWRHKDDLDFCLMCQIDGNMDRVIASGKRPDGAIKFRP